MAYDRSHLAVFIPNLKGAGAERYAVNLSRALHEAGHQVDLVVGRAVGELVDEVADGVRLIELGRSHNSANLPAMVRYLRREQPDALLSALLGANNVAVIAGKLAGGKTRIVLSQHTGLETLLETAGPRNRILAALGRRTFARAYKVVAVSQGVKDDIIGTLRLDPDHVRVIYNPVITAALQTRPETPMTHPWFQPGEPPIVLGVGRLAEQKAWHVLIRAFAKARKSHPSRLVILGQGDLRSELTRLIEELDLGDSVDLPGQVPDPLSYMRRAAVFALSSEFEGLPTVLIEALFVGVPIVSTDCPSGPSEILAGGRYGVLVPVGDIDKLAIGLEDALAGRIDPPPPQSWEPYLEANVISEYLDTLLGD